MRNAAPALCVFLAAATARAGPPPLVVFNAGADAPSEVAAARGAVAAAASDAGAAFVDVTPAPAPPPGAGTLLARAVESYDALRYDDALEGLGMALGEATRSGGAGLTAAELSDLHLYRGLVVLQRGDATRAWDDMVRSATVDPARILDPLRFPPKVLQAFQRAAREVRALPRGTLVVASRPGCRTFVDAREVAGVWPDVPFGEHYLRVECPGAGAAGALVRLAEARKELSLAPVPPASPSDDALVALARERGAPAVLIVAVTATGGAPPTAWLRLRQVPSGRPLADASVALDPGGSAAADARAAARRLIDRATGAVRLDLPPAPAPTPWYERPWVWGIAGAAVTAAILLPLAIGGGSPTGFRLQPQGELWR